MASTYLDVAKSIPGLTHLYALDATNKAKDLVGSLDGQVQGNVAFSGDKATFNGSSWIKVPSHRDFSAATTGEISVVAFMQVTNWTKQASNGEYVHWMGKGSPGSHEWTCRYYIDGGSGEAATRKRRTSFYAFNPAGGLGAGSYVQDATASATERLLVGAISTKTGSTYQFQNAVQKDKDALSGYSIKPQLTNAPVGIGSRGDGTGFLVGTIRRVAFYNRLLTEAEQKKLYDARNLPIGTEGSTTPPTPTPTSPSQPSGPTGPSTPTGPAGPSADEVFVAQQLRIKAADLISLANRLDPK
jgi:hypothetical protein